MTLLEIIPVSTSKFEDTVGHFYCTRCSPKAEMSWCGKDITNDSVAESDEDIDCVVCIGLRFCQQCKEL